MSSKHKVTDRKMVQLFRLGLEVLRLDAAERRAQDAHAASIKPTGVVRGAASLKDILGK